MRKIAWKSILITFAVSFVLGTAFGRWEASFYRQQRWKDPEARQKWILKRLDSKLNLNVEQEKQIASILKESSPQWEAIRNEMKPKFEIVRKQIRQKIEPLLTADQQTKYAEFEAEWQQRKDRRKL